MPEEYKAAAAITQKYLDLMNKELDDLLELHPEWDEDRFFDGMNDTIDSPRSMNMG